MEIVLVTEMVLAKLTSGVTERLQGSRDRHIARLEPDWGAGHADFGHPCTQCGLTGDERRSACGAAVLSVIIGERQAFLGDAVDVRRLVTDDTQAIGADVGLSDVVTKDDKIFGFAPAAVCCAAMACAAAADVVMNGPFFLTAADAAVKPAAETLGAAECQFVITAAAAMPNAMTVMVDVRVRVRIISVPLFIGVRRS
ncbi:MAG TPA: hypothetical protein VGH34_02065 [Vicinamibacterales bacterium]